MSEVPLERLFSGWRMANWPDRGGDGRPHANLGRTPGLSLFETIEQSGLADEETYILHRGQHTFAILNVFPYTSGHVMVLPLKATASIDDLEQEHYHELWDLVRTASQVIKETFHPQGMNIGINEGSAGGGSVPDHLHVHLVPRWDADTNFMTSIADTRILPMTLSDSWQRLRTNWPQG